MTRFVTIPRRREAPVVQCGCGEWNGESCEWQGSPSEMVVIEYVPEWIRASHEAAGNCGRWPHNGAVRVAVSRACADLLLASDEWASEVTP